MSNTTIQSSHNDQLMNLKQLAAYLHCSRATVYQRLRTDDMPKPYKLGLGTQNRFRKSEIDAWLETKRAQN